MHNIVKVENSNLNLHQIILYLYFQMLFKPCTQGIKIKLKVYSIAKEINNLLYQGSLSYSDDSAGSNVMEIAIRKVKPGRMEDFVQARTNYINLLKQQPGVIVSEFL